MISFLKDCYVQVFKNKVFDNNSSLNYQDYWNSRQSEISQLNDYQKYRYEWLVNNLTDEKKICDVGCGYGSILYNLLSNNNFKNSDLCGIDIEEKVMIGLKKNKIKTLSFDFSNKNNFFKIPKADCYILFEVIEHIVNSEYMIQNLFKKVNKSIFISIPNTGYLPYRLRLLFGKFPMQWKVFPNEHLRFWTLCDFKKWLNMNNYNYKIIGYKGMPLLNAIFPNLFSAGILVKISK